MIGKYITRFFSQIIATFSPKRAIQYELERAAYSRYCKKRSLSGGYDAAKTTGPNQLWSPSNKSGTYENVRNAAKIKARARDLSRNNSWIRGAKRKIIANTIGSDFHAVFMVKDENGKLDRPLNADLTRRFKRWANSAMVDGRSFHDATEMVINGLIDDGEMLCNMVVMPRRQANGNPFRLQLLETDYLDQNEGIYGIEYDIYNRPSKFYVYNQFPNDNLSLFNSQGLKTLEVKAGQMFLIYNPDRSSSYRGVSELAPIVMGMYSIDQLEAAEMDAIRSASAFGLVVTSQYSAELMERMRYSNEVDGPASTDTTDRQQYVEGGQIMYLNPGEEVKAFSNDRPNPNVIPMIDKILFGSSSAIGIANEELTNDYSRVNYSSARQSALVARRIYKQRRMNLKRKFAQRIVNEWLKYEILTGNINGLSFEQYQANPAKYEDVRFSFPGFEWIDPLKEIKAAELEIQLGLNTRENIALEKNRDFYEIAEELAAEKQKMIELDIWGDDPTAAATTSESVVVNQPEQEQQTDEEE